MVGTSWSHISWPSWICHVGDKQEAKGLNCSSYLISAASSQLDEMFQSQGGRGVATSPSVSLVVRIQLKQLRAAVGTAASRISKWMLWSAGKMELLMKIDKVSLFYTHASEHCNHTHMWDRAWGPRSHFPSNPGGLFVTLTAEKWFQQKLLKNLLI